MQGHELTFTQASVERHRGPLLDINIEYVTWVAGEIERGFHVGVTDLLGMPVADYVASMIDQVCGKGPPDGIFYLVGTGTQTLAMGGLRRLDGDLGEVKRIYVRPASRGMRLGARLLDTLLADARRFGFRRLVLDTGPFMTSAHRLYGAAGFVDRGPYPGVEAPAVLHPFWRFMECAL